MAPEQSDKAVRASGEAAVDAVIEIRPPSASDLGALEDVKRRSTLATGEYVEQLLAAPEVMAIDPANGEVKWQLNTRSPMSASMLATGGGLVFTGDAEGNVVAYDDRSGELLWSYNTGSGIRSGPVAFRLDGVEYIAVASGLGGAVGGYTGPGAPWLRNYRGGGTLFVFRLFEPNASKGFHGGARP